MRSRSILFPSLTCALFATCPSLGQDLTADETFLQSLKRAAFVAVAKVEAGVQKDEYERPLWRVVTIKKTLLDRTSAGVGLAPTWYAPLEDLRTDDYCVLVGFEVDATMVASPPGLDEMLDRDHLTMRTYTSEEAVRTLQVQRTMRVIHPTVRMPDLRQALKEGFVLVEGKEVVVQDLASIASRKRPHHASKPNKIEQDGAGQPATRAERK